VTTQTQPAYHQLLTAAYALGHTDGRLAAALDLPGTAGVLGPTCRGRDPDEFARWLWGARPGRPPSGLAANAAHWYGQGFRDGLDPGDRSRGPVSATGAVGP
jgi:hypothetical protein